MTKNRLDRIGTMIWYQAVEAGLGLHTPGAVELALEGKRVKPEKDGIKRPRKWRHYSKGRRSPDDIPGTLNVIDLAERRVPGTARWFRSPAWRALKGEIVDRFEVEEILAQSEPVRSIIFRNNNWFDLSDSEFDQFTSSNQPKLRAQRELFVENIDLCGALEGIDLLEAVILLLEHGRLSQSMAVTRRALALYEASSSKISTIPELRRELPDFFEAIEDRYVAHSNTPADEKFPPWYVRLPDVFQSYFDVEATKEAALKGPSPQGSL